MTLLERVQRALAPDYEVLRELAAGGMGVVFTARQIRLERVVAIKILRPDHATAVATERFLDEGQLLARLSHPSIVPIYDAGEADGLLYYVMQFVEGETLAERLKRGPLRPEEAGSLAHDLLAALGAAHAQNVVHRDVKPANIFLKGERALLGDFGIARWREESDPALTTPGQRIGTVKYMSPEQRDGEASTRRSDVYAAGLVLWEASTGERWPAYQPPERANWGRIPEPLVPALKKALALDPAKRWADALEFAGAVTLPRPRRRNPWIVAGLVAVATAAAYFLWPRPQPVTGIVLEIAPFEVRGAAGRSALGDSISHYLATTLDGNLDFLVREAPAKHWPGAVRLAGTVTLGSDSTRLDLVASGSGPKVTTRAGSPSAGVWRTMVDRLADTLVQRIWRGELEGEKWLPLAALPHTAGLGRWHAAERFYAQGRWETADSAYRSVERDDSTCLLCSYRVIDISRWLSGAGDSSRLARVVAHIDSFPLHYQALITAQRLDWPARYDSLERAARRWPDFFLTSFILGDELFHRGPLHGHLRKEALEPILHALSLKSDFAPGNEHLAWLLLSEGGKLETRRALDSVPPETARAGLSKVIRLMLNIGYLWRFETPADAERFTQGVLRDPTVVGDPRTPAGGRMMMTLDTPKGAVGLGRALEELPSNPEAERNGLLAQAHGYAALGRLDSLRVTGTRLGRTQLSRSLALYVLELEAALTLADADPLVRTDPALRRALEHYAFPGAESPALQRRATWILALLARREGNDSAGARFRALLQNDTAAGTLRGTVELWDALTRGDTARAGRALGALLPPDLTRSGSDPLEDAMLRLMRAELFSRQGSLRDARDSLRWHEHLQLNGFPIGDPQPCEVAWALGTLVRWRRARLLDAGGQTGPELCATYGAVARLWRDGTPRYAARADTARQRFVALGCREPA